MTWPTIQAPSFPLEEEIIKPQIKTEFEAGYAQSRPRATVAKRRFRLVWKAMPDADFTSLASAFASDQGSAFTWTHPSTSSSYTVRYAEDGLRSTLQTTGLRSVSVTLEQVP